MTLQKQKLELANAVCQILLVNGYTHQQYREGDEVDAPLCFQNNVLGAAMMAWWLANHPKGKATLKPFKQASVEELFGEITKIQKLHSIVTGFATKSDHDCCIFCNEVFPKSKPEPRCKCVSVDANGRVYEP